MSSCIGKNLPQAPLGVGVPADFLIFILVFDDHQAVADGVHGQGWHWRATVGSVGPGEKIEGLLIRAGAEDAGVERVIILRTGVLDVEVGDRAEPMRADLDQLRQRKGGEEHVGDYKTLRNLCDAENIGQVAALLRGARGGWLQHARALIDPRPELPRGDRIVRRQAQKERVLGFVRAGQILAIELIDDAEIKRAPKVLNPAGQWPAKRQRAMIIQIAVRILGEPLGNLGSDQPSLGGAHHNCQVGLAKNADELLPQVLRVLGGIGHGPAAKSNNIGPITRRGYRKAELQQQWP